MLSGEEFARTKGGLDNTYNAPISLNQLDWERAWKERELVDYYRGLIALRKLLPGLCDKSEGAGSRITGMWKKPLAVGFQVDNRGKAGEKSRWERLFIVYNAGEKDLPLTLPAGRWEVLADGTGSFGWENPDTAERAIAVEPVSALVLGLRSQGETKAGEG